MPNVHVTTSLVLKETLMHLENDLVLGNLIHTDHSKDFTKVGDTVNARRPVRFQGQSDNLDVSAYNEDIIEGTVPIVMNRTETIKFEIDPVDKVLSVERMRERYVEPAVIKLKDRIETEIANLYKDVYFYSGTPGTTPGTFLELGEVGTLMTYNAVPQGNRMAVHNPDTALALSDGLKNVYVESKAKTAFEEQTIGRYARFNNYESVHIPTHRTGNHGGTPLVNGAAQVVTYDAVKDTYVQTLATDGWAAASTLLKGDVFTIAGVFGVNPISKQSTGRLQTFVVKEDAPTTVGKDIVISPPIIDSGAYQTVSAVPADNAAITVVSGAADTEYRQSMMFNKNAFALVTRPLQIASGQGLETQTMSGNKVSLSVSKTTDFNTLKEKCRLDMLFGTVTLQPHLAARQTS